MIRDKHKHILFFNSDIKKRGALSKQRRISSSSCFVRVTVMFGIVLEKEQTRPRGYKTFSMLNSAEHEILNAHKYKNVKNFSFF